VHEGNVRGAGEYRELGTWEARDVANHAAARQLVCSQVGVDVTDPAAEWRLPQGVIHGDANTGNLLLTPDGYTMLTHLVPGTHRVPERPGPVAGTPLRFDADPGTLLIMAAATWHRSGLNRSDRPRTAVLMSFVERWIKPMSAPSAGLAELIPQRLRILLGLDEATETINGIPV